MRHLVVELHYGTTDYNPFATETRAGMALPLRVLDAEGTVLAEGVASREEPAQFNLPGDDDPVFVRLTWPSGRTETRRADLGAGGNNTVIFDDGAISNNEWSAWAAPRVTGMFSTAKMMAPEAPRSERSAGSTGIAKFDNVWIQLWKRDGARWHTADLPISQHYANEDARQIDLRLDPGCWLLQFGGPRVPWRFVSLPGGGPCRVLITPSGTKYGKADPLKAVVTGFRSDAETLLEFLSRDALRAASSVARLQSLSTDLLYQKVADPISAVAGAYFLLRSDGWREIPTGWFERLYEYDWIPDTAVILCSAMIRRGLAEPAQLERAVQLLHECLDRGMPLFDEGMSLLLEARSLLAVTSDLNSSQLFNRIDVLSASRAWAGSAFSFYGEVPDRPNPERIVGQRGEGRTADRRKRFENKAPSLIALTEGPVAAMDAGNSPESAVNRMMQAHFSALDDFNRPATTLGNLGAAMKRNRV